MTTFTLPFKQHQNIAETHCFPDLNSLGKKWDNLRLMLRSTLWMKFLKIGEIWKELDQTKRMQPTGIFSDHPFRSYNSLKMTCLKRILKSAAFFVTCNLRFLISWLELAAISKRFKIGGSDWAHFLRLFEIFPSIMNF